MFTGPATTDGGSDMAESTETPPVGVVCESFSVDAVDKVFVIFFLGGLLRVDDCCDCFCDVRAVDAGVACEPLFVDAVRFFLGGSLRVDVFCVCDVRAMDVEVATSLSQDGSTLLLPLLPALSTTLDD